MAKSTEHLFIEIASGHFRAGVLSLVPNRPASVYLAAVEASGMRRGDVFDASAASAALERLLSRLEAAGHGDFRSCDLMLPGSQVFSRIVTARIKLHGLAVNHDHGEELRSELAVRSTDDSSEVVDISIQSWLCGGSQSPSLPVGRKGSDLEAIAFCSTADKQVLARLVSLCNGVGLEVKATHSSIASAAALISRLSSEASNRVIIDIGHSFTTGIILVGQRANSMFSVRAGANHITRDIAAALNCELSVAEKLKRLQGLALSKSSPVLALPPAPSIHAPSEVSRDIQTETIIYPWAAPRVAEILALALRHFAIYIKALDGGITLIGGGSQTPELCGFAASKLSGVKITRFKPSQESLASALGLDLSASEGLSLCGFEGIIEAVYQQWKSKSTERHHGGKTPPFLRPLLSWFTDLSK